MLFFCLVFMSKLGTSSYITLSSPHGRILAGIYNKTPGFAIFFGLGLFGFFVLFLVVGSLVETRQPD